MTRSRSGLYNQGMRKKNTKAGATLGQITILSEKQVPYVELKIDMDDPVAHKLAQAGWLEIQHDREALINYAFNKALEEFCRGNAGRTR